MYEGEVTELTPTESENPLSGYGKTVSHVIVGMKTVKGISHSSSALRNWKIEYKAGTKQLRLDPSIYESILKEKVIVGDVVYIEANTGAVKVTDFFPSSSEAFIDVVLFVESGKIGHLCISLRSRIRNLRPATKRGCP